MTDKPLILIVDDEKDMSKFLVFCKTISIKQVIVILVMKL